MFQSIYSISKVENCDFLSNENSTSFSNFPMKFVLLSQANAQWLWSNRNKVSIDFWTWTKAHTELISMSNIALLGRRLTSNCSIIIPFKPRFDYSKKTIFSIFVFNFRILKILQQTPWLWMIASFYLYCQAMLLEQTDLGWYGLEVGRPWPWPWCFCCWFGWCWCFKFCCGWIREGVDVDAEGGWSTYCTVPPPRDEELKETLLAVTLFALWWLMLLAVVVVANAVVPYIAL